MPTTIHAVQGKMSQAYLIATDTGLYLVDAGLPGEAGKILKAMKMMGRDDLRLIFITHAHLDHFGSAAALRRATGAPIAIHKDDAEAMTRGETIIGSARGRGRVIRLLLPVAEWWTRPEGAEPDIVLTDGCSLTQYGLNADVLHTPGHTLGSCCLQVEERHVFAGDLLLSTGQPHVQQYFAQDWRLLAQSLRRLQSHDPQVVYPGHGRATIDRETLMALRPEESKQ